MRQPSLLKLALIIIVTLQFLGQHDARAETGSSVYANISVGLPKYKLEKILGPISLEPPVNDFSYGRDKLEIALSRSGYVAYIRLFHIIPNSNDISKEFQLALHTYVDMYGEPSRTDTSLTLGRMVAEWRKGTVTTYLYVVNNGEFYHTSPDLLMSISSEDSLLWRDVSGCCFTTQ